MASPSPCGPRPKMRDSVPIAYSPHPPTTTTTTEVKRKKGRAGRLSGNYWNASVAGAPTAPAPGDSPGHSFSLIPVTFMHARRPPPLSCAPLLTCPAMSPVSCHRSPMVACSPIMRPGLSPRGPPTCPPAPGAVDQRNVTSHLAIGTQPAGPRRPSPFLAQLDGSVWYRHAVYGYYRIRV